MARPLSKEKRNAILAAATDAIATMGIGAATAKIALAAGLAEGTLFSYFETKDALLNQLYIEIEQEMSTSVLNDRRIKGELVHSWRLVWDRCIDWGEANPAKRKTLRQLSVSTIISEASREMARQATRDGTALLEESLKSGVLRKQSPEFIIGTLTALVEMTLDFMAREPKQRERYKRAGFETLWNAIAMKGI
jgi:AcrR family transcriptional regulator